MIELFLSQTAILQFCDMIKELPISQFSSVQSLSRIWLFTTPWITVHQASLSITNSWSSLKLMSIESLFLVSCYLSFPFSSVQFSSVAQSCLTLWDPMGCRMPGLPVHHQLPEFTQTHVQWVGDAIQPSHPLLSHSPPSFNSPASESFQMSQLFWSDG